MDLDLADHLAKLARVSRGLREDWGRCTVRPLLVAEDVPTRWELEDEDVSA